MEQKKKLDDLLIEIKNGDYFGFDVLLEIYRPLIEGSVSNFSSLDSDDVRQISSISLFNAVRSYDLEGKVTFGLYAKICINNALITELRKSINASNISIESVDDESDIVCPEEFLIRKESFEEKFAFLKSALTEYEYDVFRLYLLGYSYKQISQMLIKDENSVGNALSRVKTKIKNHHFD